MRDLFVTLTETNGRPISIQPHFVAAFRSVRIPGTQTNLTRVKIFDEWIDVHETYDEVRAKLEGRTVPEVQEPKPGSGE